MRPAPSCPSVCEIEIGQSHISVVSWPNQLIFGRLESPHPRGHFDPIIGYFRRFSTAGDFRGNRSEFSSFVISSISNAFSLKSVVSLSLATSEITLACLVNFVYNTITLVNVGYFSHSILSLYSVSFSFVNIVYINKIVVNVGYSSPNSLPLLQLQRCTMCNIYAMPSASALL